MTDPATTLEGLAAKAGQLYSLPVVAMQVLELTNNPELDARELKQCIENDPALTTKLLRVVNSSLFGLSREVSDLSQALALLGIKPLKLLVLGFSLPGELFAGVAAEILERYWRHTLTKAVSAREISETLWHQPGDEAFIAGLLEDLGILLLIQELGEPYVRFLEKVFARGYDLAALETQSMGFDHTMLTAKLLAHWGLPQALVEAVGRRSDRHTQKPSPLRSPALPQVLELAELFARFLADGRADVLARLLAVGESDHRLTRKQLEELLENLEEKVQQLADVLSLQLPEGLHYADLLARAHSQLADVASQAAEDLIRHQYTCETSEAETAAVLDEFQSLSEAVARAARRGGGVSHPRIPSTATGHRWEMEIPHRAPGRDAAVSYRWQVERVDRSSTSGPQPKPKRTMDALQATPSAPADAPACRAATIQADPGLLGQLGAAVTACRQNRCPLSLVLVELDDMDDLVLRYRVEGFGNLRSLLEDACGNVDHPYASCCPHGEAGFAVILPNCDRQLAVQLGNQLIDRARRLPLCLSSGGHTAVSLSVGAATVSLPPKNFPPQDLFDAANRCLYGSHASGGVVVKSIEIY